jgi:hypothetical protein
MPDLVDTVPWHCQLGCTEPITGAAGALEHARIVHRDDAERWPDGGLVVLDATLEPGDFA